MAVRKIAITVPPTTLQRIDGWAEKLKISRSQFIVDQVEKQLEDLEDEEVTRLYNEAYSDEQAAEENRALAEEMLRLSSEIDRDEKW